MFVIFSSRCRKFAADSLVHITDGKEKTQLLRSFMEKFMAWLESEKFSEEKLNYQEISSKKSHSLLL